MAGRALEDEKTIGCAPCCSDEEASYVLVATGLSDERFPLNLQRANGVIQWLSQRPDGESAARVLSEAVAEGRDAVFSLEQRAVLCDELVLRRQRLPTSIYFDSELIDLYFELLLEFGEFDHSNGNAGSAR